MKAASAQFAHPQQKFFAPAQQRPHQHKDRRGTRKKPSLAPFTTLSPLSITAQSPKQNLLIVFLLEQRSSTVGRVHRH